MRVKIKSKRTDEQLSILKSFSAIMCIYLRFWVYLGYQKWKYFIFFLNCAIANFNISLEKKDLIIRCIVTSLNIGIDLNQSLRWNSSLNSSRWCHLRNWRFRGVDSDIFLSEENAQLFICHIKLDTIFTLVIKFMINKNHRMKLTRNIKFCNNKFVVHLNF